MSNIIIKEKVIDEQVYPLIKQIKELISSSKFNEYRMLDTINNKQYNTLKNLFDELDNIGLDIRTLENSISDAIYEAHVIQKRLENNSISGLKPLVPIHTLSATMSVSTPIIELVDIEMPNHVKYNFFTGIEKKIESVSINIAKCYDTYIIGDKFDKYRDFRNCLIDNKFTSKPCRDTSYATQGVCEIGNMTFITSYDTGYEKGKKDRQMIKYSTLDIIGKDGEIKTLYFPHTAHVGGIGYCDDRELIYVCGDGKVEYYSIEQLANASDKSTIIPIGEYEFAKKKGSGNNSITKASFLTTNKNDVWVGEFQYAKDHKLGFGSDPELMRYETDELGNLIPKEMYTLPWRNVQGMCIAEYEGEEYYIFSTSEGRDNPSYLRVCTLENGKFKESGKIKMPCLSEQVSLTEDGNLMIVFESDCDKYGEGADGNGCSTKQVGNVCYLDLEEVMIKCD